MENTGEEPKALFNELIQGKELVKQLRVHLNPSSSTGELLIDLLQSTFDRAISMVNISGSDPQVTGLNNTGMLESPRSKSDSPRSDDSGPSDLSKRRKALPKWTEKVGVSSATSTGIEGPLDDGYSWRKYGQKDILGAKYPRGYYRCTYRKTQGCLAKKQVQRSSNPSIFDVTYQGRHTCLQVSHLIAISNLQQNQNQNQSQTQNQNQKQDQQEEQKPRLSQEVLLNFEAGLRIKTENDFIDTHDPSSSFSFASTSMPVGSIKNENNNFSPLDSNYYVTNYSQRNNIGSHAFPNFHTTTSESDRNEILSAANSAPDSPILGMDFTLDDALELDPNFQFSSYFH